MRGVFFGTSAFAVPSLRAFAARVTCALVVTQPDRPSGRGLRLRPTPVKVAARELGLPTIEPERLRDAMATLAALDADVFALASYGKLVPQAILDLPPLGALNVHPSLLPRYRGAAPLQGQLRDGVADGGVTIIAMDAGLDTGDIVAVRRASIGPRETYGELHDRFAELGATLLGEACEALRAGPLPRTSQAGLAPERDVVATMTRPLSKRDFDLASHTGATMTGLVNLIRSVAPSPGTRVASVGHGVAKVLAAHEFGGIPEFAAIDVAVGELISIDGWLLARAVDGWIAIDHVVPEGRRTHVDVRLSFGYEYHRTGGPRAFTTLVVRAKPRPLRRERIFMTPSATKRNAASGSERAPAKANAREVAFQVVRDVFGPEQRGAQAAFDARTRRANLDQRDRAFAAELAYGTIKRRRLLDHYLRPYVGTREKALPETIVDVLRLGVYQLRFMSGVDDHAAVSETVNLAWRHGHKGTAGLVNAVLRRALADGTPGLIATDFKSDDDYAGTAFSVPTWIAAQYGRALGPARDAALAGINRAPQLALRVNALRADVASVRATLAERGIVTEPSSVVAESLVATDGTCGDDPEGRWSVQGEAATMPVDLLAPRPGETVLEFCSGRGNKTVQLAARMANDGSLVCVERDAKKIAVLEATLARAGVTIAALVHGDATEAARDVDADAVLLDAPCSGLGVLGRHPEARWRKTPEDGARLAPLQAALLEAAAARVKPGGRLVYAVCSTDPREGREVVDAFLTAHPAFARAPLPPRYAHLARVGDVLVPPGIDGRDGFSIATLVRTP